MSEATYPPQPVAPAAWVNVVRYIEFGVTTVGSRRISGASVKGVALTLMSYAHEAESGLFYPHVELLARDAEVSYAAAKAVMSRLRSVGLIVKVSSGGGRSGKAASYYLAVPDDLGQRVRVRTEADMLRLIAELTPRDGYRKHQAVVFARDGQRCLACGATGDLTLDHVVPQSRGGSDEPDNLQTLCLSCNCRKGAKTIRY